MTTQFLIKRQAKCSFRHVRRLTRTAILLTAITSCLTVVASRSKAYSVLSHEAIVDSLWDAPIQKMLLTKFPGTTPDELKDAHAYAYGGCIIQDMGYYPFSSKLFSDLTHYVRTGDFVTALIRESQNVNEYAFALGALAHYAADITGHGQAVNEAVPILYPALRTRFGAVVTYWDNPLSHIRTEFGFDVLQVAQGRYASDKYRDFIGFKVSKPVLERAVMDTYGLEMKDLFGTEDLAIGTFRYTTSSVIPKMTKLAWKLRSDAIVKESPGMTRQKFLFNLSRSSYEKDWGRDYKRPGLGATVLAFFLRVVPKIGPFRGLAFRPPNAQVEALFMKSFNATVDQYRRMLLNQTANNVPEIPNDNFDTGGLTEPNKYLGADLAYDKLLAKLKDKKFASVKTDLRDNILKYYELRKPPADTGLDPKSADKRVTRREKKARADWEKVVANVEELRQFQVGVVAAR